MIQYRSPGTSGNNGTASDLSVTITLPTGWQAGDILFVIIRVGTSAETITQTAGTGTWTIDFTTSNGVASYTIAVAHRVMASGDNAPTFSWGTAGRQCWSCGGFYSDANGTLALDKWGATDPVQASTVNSIIPNSVAAANSNEASMVLTGARATASGSATSHAYTPPTGWTWNDGDGSFSASGLNARFAANAYNLNVSGTVTPGSESLTDSTSDTFFLAVYHALVSETVPPAVSLPFSNLNISRTELIGRAEGRVVRQPSVILFN